MKDTQIQGNHNAFRSRAQYPPSEGRPGMFAVETYAAVRRFVFVEGKSRREAARVGLIDRLKTRFGRTALGERQSEYELIRTAAFVPDAPDAPDASDGQLS